MLDLYMIADLTSTTLLAGAAGRPVSEAEASAAETRAQLGKAVRLRVRYKRDGAGAREDRPYNTQQRLDAFAARPVVAKAQSCQEAGVSDNGGTTAACTLVEFKVRRSTSRMPPYSSVRLMPCWPI